MPKKFSCSHALVEFKKYIKVPLEAGVRNFVEVTKYFMYFAPNIDCVHSCGRIVGVDAEKAFQKMISSSDMTDRYKIVKNIKEASWNEYKLVGNKICMQCNRMTFERFKNEDDLTALLRHIRNSFAHGLIYIKKSGKNGAAHLMLEDFDSKKKKCTARIVITFKQLEEWKAILENEKAVGE